MTEEKHSYLTLGDGTVVTNKERAVSLLDAAQKQVDTIITTLTRMQERPQASEAEQTEITTLLDCAYEIGIFLASKRIGIQMTTLGEIMDHLKQEAERRTTNGL